MNYINMKQSQRECDRMELKQIKPAKWGRKKHTHTQMIESG